MVDTTQPGKLLFHVCRILPFVLWFHRSFCYQYSTRSSLLLLLFTLIMSCSVSSRITHSTEGSKGHYFQAQRQTAIVLCIHVIQIANEKGRKGFCLRLTSAVNKMTNRLQVTLKDRRSKKYITPRRHFTSNCLANKFAKATYTVEMTCKVKQLKN